MNKNLKLIVALSLILLTISSCKTKQKVTKVPAGANIEATAPAEEITTPAAIESTGTSNVGNAKEVTRNENFKLAEGETNLEALKFKYHVVVGSFSKKENAKSLQSLLNSEGNKSIVVVNELDMYRVLIASFNDYNQAHARIKEIETRFPGSWVLVQK